MKILDYWFYILSKILEFIILKIKNIRSSLLYFKYKKELCLNGENIRLNGVSIIVGGKNVSIDANVHIGDNAYIRGEGGLEIGRNTHISRNLVLYTHNHNYQGICLPYDNTFIYKPVKIGQNVWIGINVVILPGTIIEEGAVIGAGCVVSGKINKGEIVVANKPFNLKVRDIDHYNQLKTNNKFGGINGKPITE